MGEPLQEWRGTGRAWLGDTLGRFLALIQPYTSKLPQPTRAAGVVPAGLLAALTAGEQACGASGGLSRHRQPPRGTHFIGRRLAQLRRLVVTEQHDEVVHTEHDLVPRMEDRLAAHTLAV